MTYQEWGERPYRRSSTDRRRGVRVDRCPWGHGHPMSEGIAECFARYRAELARFGVKYGDKAPPCCGHDPVIEHTLTEQGYLCRRCWIFCQELGGTP